MGSLFFNIIFLELQYKRIENSTLETNRFGEDVILRQSNHNLICFFAIEQISITWG
jgi:hypothetical protein